MPDHLHCSEALLNGVGECFISFLIANPVLHMPRLNHRHLGIRRFPGDGLPLSLIFLFLHGLSPLPLVCASGEKVPMEKFVNFFEVPCIFFMVVIVYCVACYISFLKKVTPCGKDTMDQSCECFFP